ncbi:MAG: hypothetical protein ACYC26_14080 [Phycisphaerales bacterium]
MIPADFYRKGRKAAKAQRVFEMDQRRETPDELNELSKQVIGAAIAVHRELGLVLPRQRIPRHYRSNWLTATSASKWKCRFN